MCVRGGRGAGFSLCQSAAETRIPCFWFVHHICISLVPGWEGLQFINNIRRRAPIMSCFSCITCCAQSKGEKEEEEKTGGDMCGREKGKILRNGKTKASKWGELGEVVRSHPVCLVSCFFCFALISYNQAPFCC